MHLTIDSLEYTSTLDGDHPPCVTRRLNRPSEMTAHLFGCDTRFVVPALGARIVLSRNDGGTVFSGSLTSAPEHEYLGWGERGPEYRYVLRAVSDEALLSAKPLPDSPAFVA